MYDYEAYGLLIAILVVCLVVGTILMTIYVIYYYVLRGLLARTTTVPATVVRKTQREYGGVSTSYDDGLIAREADAFTSVGDLFVLFDVGGKRLEFSVPERVYIAVEEGDAGLLTHKGTIFRRFLKDAQFQAQSGRATIRKV